MWLVALFAFLFIALVVFDFVQKPKREKAAREARERRQAEVARRGWTLEVTSSGNSTVSTYSGTTDGVRWQCEMNSWKSSRIGRASQEKVFTRWSTSEAVLPHGILAIWPNFGEAQQITTQVPQFIMNLILSPLVKALGTDAATAEFLANAMVVADHNETLNERYLLRATDEPLMHRFLDAGARGALVDAGSWLPDRSDPNHLVLALIGTQGLSILLAGWVDDINTIDRISVVGARLVNAYRVTLPA
jgi:hypothetical protein